MHRKILLTLAALAFLGCPETQPASRPAPQSTQAAAATPTKPAEPADPWPECKAVRQWLRENTGDPDSVEVIEWERKYPAGGGNGQPVVEVKYRSKNRVGGWSGVRRQFLFKDDKITNTYVKESY